MSFLRTTNLGLLLAMLSPLAVHAASISGSYTGNGASLTINVGFQPDVVIIKDEIAPSTGASKGVQIRTATMTFTKNFGQVSAGATGTDRITAFTSTGFTVGASNTVNVSGVKYNWFAIKEQAGEIKVGTYTGDGIDNRNIMGVGFQPDFVMAMDSSGAPAMWRTADMPADDSQTFDFSGGPNYIQSLLPDGFQVGTDTRVNASGVTHHYIACKNVVGKFKVGTYVGDGTTPRAFNGMGFRPEAIIVKRNSTTIGNLRFAATGASTITDITLQPNESTYATNAILSLDNDGFTIGNPGNRINGTTFPNTYYWFAFANVAASAPPAPEISVTESSTNIADGGSFSFGTTTAGTPVTKTFTITNSGTGNLTLSGLTVPSGFSIAQNFASTTVTPSASTTFQITMSAASAGSPSGTLSFINDDSDENPYNFTISGTVNPPPAPIVTNVTSSTANAAYRAGQSVSIQVTFDSSVTVTGTPTLALNSGGSASYVSGSPGTTLTFTYTVGAGQNSTDLDYSATNSLALSGGSIVSSVGAVAATLTLPSPGAAGSLGANKAIVIDTVAPTVVSVVRQNPTAQTTSASSVVFRVTYSEPVTGIAAARYQIVNVNGGTVTGTIGTPTGGPTIYDVPITITGGSGEFRLRVAD